MEVLESNPEGWDGATWSRVLSEARDGTLHLEGALARTAGGARTARALSVEAAGAAAVAAASDGRGGDGDGTGSVVVSGQSAPWRALIWRLLLGVVAADRPPQEWVLELQAQRRKYRAVKEEVFPDISSISGASDGDPLSAAAAERQEEMEAAAGGRGSSGDDDAAANNPWRTFYQSNELLTEIQTDLERLYPAGVGDYFMRPDRQELLRNVLFVWARMHKQTSYRQGMHEVAAPLLLVIETEAHFCSSLPANHLLRNASTSEHLEADTFWLFSRIMVDLEPMYGMPSNEAAVGTPSGQPQQPLLVDYCDRIQSTRLRVMNPRLAKHLRDEEVPSHLYGMKWVRLLFNRDFHMDDVLLVWDFLFAQTFSSVAAGRAEALMEPVEEFYMAMILFVSETLQESDNMGCLNRLMRYPPIHDIRDLIGLAKQVHAKFYEEGGSEQQQQNNSYRRADESDDDDDILAMARKATPQKPRESSSAPSWMMASNNSSSSGNNNNNNNGSRPRPQQQQRAPQQQTQQAQVQAQQGQSTPNWLRAGSGASASPPRSPSQAQTAPDRRGSAGRRDMEQVFGDLRKRAQDGVQRITTTVAEAAHRLRTPGDGSTDPQQQGQAHSQKPTDRTDPTELSLLLASYMAIFARQLEEGAADNAAAMRVSTQLRTLYILLLDSENHTTRAISSAMQDLLHSKVGDTETETGPAAAVARTAIMDSAQCRDTNPAAQRSEARAQPNPVAPGYRGAQRFEPAAAPAPTATTTSSGSSATSSGAAGTSTSMNSTGKTEGAVDDLDELLSGTTSATTPATATSQGGDDSDVLSMMNSLLNDVTETVGTAAAAAEPMFAAATGVSSTSSSTTNTTTTTTRPEEPFDPLSAALS